MILKNSAKNGTILFSLGADLRCDHLEPSKIDMFVEAFRSLPQLTFIWKLDGRHKVTNLPKNVHILDWIPQLALLKEKKIIAMITNGGLLSLQETAWHAKPVIGLPLYLDQQQNVERFVRYGVAINLDYKELSIGEIVAAIKQIQDQKYTRAMDVLSIRLGTNIAHPLEIAAFWIEQVTFLEGAPHFYHPPARMNFMKAHLLDVWIVVGLMIFLYFYFVVYRNLRPNKKTTMTTATSTVVANSDGKKTTKVKSIKKND